MNSPDLARERLVSDIKEGDYNLDAYVHKLLGPQARADLQPFFVEIVDENNKLVAIPFPPEYNVNNTTRYILGLKFLVNPNTLSINMAKLINRTQTMVSWVEEHWGEELDTITFAGSTAAFVTGAPTLRGITDANRRYNQGATSRSDYYSYLGLSDLSVKYQTSAPNDSYYENVLGPEPGLTTRYRRSSLSYKQLKQFIEIFAANGCIFDGQGLVRDRLYIRLSYDYSSYIGYFESIDVTEEASNPYRFIYTVTFKAEKTLFNRRNVS